MILDAQGQLSSAQALTDGETASTNLVDLGVDRNVGIGEPLGVLINVTVAAKTSDNDETYQFDLMTDSAVGFGTEVDVLTRIIARGTLVAGFKFVLPVPPDTITDRYLRVSYTLGGTAGTITVDSHLMPMSMIQKEVVYPDNITITT